MCENDVNSHLMPSMGMLISWMFIECFHKVSYNLCLPGQEFSGIVKYINVDSKLCGVGNFVLNNNYTS